MAGRPRKSREDNPRCPYCGGTTGTNGKMSKYQRYKCDDCGKNFTDSPNPQTGYRPNLVTDLGRPMTAAERWAKYKAAHPEQVKEQIRQHQKSLRYALTQHRYRTSDKGKATLFRIMQNRKAKRAADESL